MKKFEIALLGPNTPEKYRLIDRLAQLDIGEALGTFDLDLNPVDYSIIFEFREGYREIEILDYGSRVYDKSTLLGELNAILEEDLNRFFEYINSQEFMENSDYIKLGLAPARELIPDNNIYDSLSIISNRGFIEGYGFEDRQLVNSIVFHAYDYIQNPLKFPIAVDADGGGSRESIFYLEYLKNDMNISKKEEMDRRIRTYARDMIMDNLAKELMGYIVFIE